MERTLRNILSGMDWNGTAGAAPVLKIGMAALLTPFGKAVFLKYANDIATLEGR